MMRYAMVVLQYFKALLCLFILILPSYALSQGTWKPSKNVEIIIGAGAGGAADTTGRLMQRILQERKLVESPLVVVNKPGGGYSVAWTYMNSHAGDGHFIAPTALSLLTNAMTGGNPLTFSDVTPLAKLFTDYVVLAVRSDSKIADAKDFIAHMRRSPESISVALAAARGNQNHLAIGMALKAANIDPKLMKVVIFDSSANSMTALLGGHVDAVAATALNVLPHLKAGRVRVLAISSPRRLSGELAGIPTWKEQGVDAVFENWRGVIGPRGMQANQISFWEEAFARLVETEEWKNSLEKNYFTDSFMRSRESVKFLEQEHSKIKALLVDLGLAK